jgi:hypothetical protein
VTNVLSNSHAEWTQNLKTEHDVDIMGEYI